MQSSTSPSPAAAPTVDTRTTSLPSVGANVTPDSGFQTSVIVHTRTTKVEVNVTPQDAASTAESPAEGVTIDVNGGVARISLHPRIKGADTSPLNQAAGSSSPNVDIPYPMWEAAASPAGSGVSYRTAPASPVGISNNRSPYRTAPGSPAGSTAGRIRRRDSSSPFNRACPGRARSSGSIDEFTSWSLVLRRRKVNGLSMHTEWYESCGSHEVTGPPLPLLKLARDPYERPFPVGRLYVHILHQPGRRKAVRRTQVWMWKKIAVRGSHAVGTQGAEGTGKRTVEKFVPIFEEHKHPVQKDLQLHFAENGRPRWIRESTARSYASKKTNGIDARVERIQNRGQ
ncbi:uncharacterized protein TRAVEDRAFT_60834 [Trametes versicolor FP-101664 SS1]|uniref:uncharacterized protein n=1 Tax=Trametes versicolor (strain FP-101664) TaxID=717944 RepID=UPI0004623811|nr:uncharacterized protein TRAVEDRAFT_60834 [Trametes versicolor FP-101664 SS1]EIW53343.1 hypothetical protein TRAVEDRAFT_60834 [Trametes versicolor FP-101664 SS1]